MWKPTKKNQETTPFIKRVAVIKRMQSVATLIEKGLLTINEDERKAFLHEGFWALRPDDKSYHRNVCENLATFILYKLVSDGKAPDEVLICELFNPDGTKHLASFHETNGFVEHSSQPSSTKICDYRYHEHEIETLGKCRSCSKLK